MPPDQGEKFHHSYCAFPDQPAFAPVQERLLVPGAVAARSILEAEIELQQSAAGRNSSSSEVEILTGYRPPFALSFGSESAEEEAQERRVAATGWRRRAAEALAFLERRQWACPTGTSSCADIGYPNSCCGTGETCVEVEDTGLGPVGCCPAGASCGGSVQSCADGSMPCASDIGGGCCIPGFVCQGVGCVRSASATPTPTPSPTGIVTLTSTSTTVISTNLTPSTVVITVIVTITPSQTPPTTTRTTTQIISAPLPTSSSASNGPGAPYRPTSSSSIINTFCPTGFYACLASAGGGCCQTGRDCQTTSCPPVALTTIVNTNGITVVVPAAEVPAATTGNCATGWFMCGREAGPLPGCCPSGYSCGTASCSVVEPAGGTATVAKAVPGEAVRIRGWGMWGIVMGIMGVMLL
ncbi:hypothetical protein B0H67DRAFT_600026 [Lasiosphaeris hirsuta]|uniref:GPI anchored protein n=1 Tax=Lasiosphaeris hirsuta TaxID=260670 RepID=A0AA40ARB0_9PEZI|nr:hypothetical protein B0H67DRAFT_600026 [Lasiosphaeris hirsuta]